MNSYDFLESVDISGQVPANFYTQMDSKKWSDRKEALEVIDKITSVPKIHQADFSELVRVLKKTVAKDSNIVVATLAAKCMCQLAQGLRTNFAPYANSCLTILFEKFKEKKPNVNSVIREATDAAFIGTNIENIHEDIILFLDNKNPQIKSEMTLFLARTFSKFPAQVMNKKTLRPLINSLIKTLSDMDSTVRDNSALAIGTAMKVTGEKLMMTLIADVEPIKIAKIKECCEKAEIVEATTNGVGAPAEAVMTNGQQSAPVSDTNGVAEEADDDEDNIYDMLEAVDISNDITANFYTQMESKKWGERKEALEVIDKITSVPKIQNADFSELVRVLKKTVAKDSNIVVATLAAKCMCQLAQGLRSNFAPYANSCLTILFEKFKEKKPNVNSVIREAADAAFIGTNIENIHEDIILFLDNKNPQIKSEMTLFLARTFSKFPAQVMNKKTLRPLINSLIKTLSDMDSTVRDNSALAIGTAMKVTGEKLMMTLIADVEPIKIAKIKECCEKAEVKKIPQALLNAMNTNSAPSNTGIAAPSIPNNNKPMGPPRSSSATMIRSTSRKPAPKVAQKVAGTAAGSNATVKRTATIIKRSTTVPKRASTLPQQPPVVAPPAQPPQVVNKYATNNIAPPSHDSPPQVQQQVQMQPLHVPTPIKPVFATSQANNIKLSPRNDLDMVIFKLISDQPEEVMESITELELSLSDETEDVYKSRINQIIDLTCLQLIKSFDSHKTISGSNSHSPIHKIKKISDCLMKIFTHPNLVSAASQQSIKFLLVQLFTLSQTYGNNNFQSEDETIIKSLNNLASAVMDSFEPASMMCILTGLLNDPPPTSIVEPIKRAIIRSMRSFN